MHPRWQLQSVLRQHVGGFFAGSLSETPTHCKRAAFLSDLPPKTLQTRREVQPSSNKLNNGVWRVHRFRLLPSGMASLGTQVYPPDSCSPFYFLLSVLGNLGKNRLNGNENILLNGFNRLSTRYLLACLGPYDHP